MWLVWLPAGKLDGWLPTWLTIGKSLPSSVASWACYVADWLVVVVLWLYD